MVDVLKMLYFSNKFNKWINYILIFEDHELIGQHTIHKNCLLVYTTYMRQIVTLNYFTWISDLEIRLFGQVLSSHWTTCNWHDTCLVCHRQTVWLSLVNFKIIVFLWYKVLFWYTCISVDMQYNKPEDHIGLMSHCRCLFYVYISNPTSLVLFSIPGIPGAHQLTGVVLISMDGGQNILTVMNEKHQNQPNKLKSLVDF